MSTDVTERPLERIVGPYCLYVPVGNGAVHAIPSPQADPHIQYSLRYGNDRTANIVAAEMLSNFDFLLSEHVSMKEATRRIGLLRKARRRVSRPNASLSSAPLSGAPAQT